MGSGAVCVIIATFMQAFSPRGEVGCFIAGRVLIGIGQGLALSEYSRLSIKAWAKVLTWNSFWFDLHWRTGSSRDPWKNHVVLADVLLCGLVHCLL